MVKKMFVPFELFTFIVSHQELQTAKELILRF